MLLKQKHYDVVLILLYTERHAAIERIYPALREEGFKAVPHDLEIDEATIRTLQEYAWQAIFWFTLMAIFLILLGAGTLMISVVSFVSIVLNGATTDTLVTLCTPLVGLGPLIFGLSNYRIRNRLFVSS